MPNVFFDYFLRALCLNFNISFPFPHHEIFSYYHKKRNGVEDKKILGGEFILGGFVVLTIAFGLKRLVNYSDSVIPTILFSMKMKNQAVPPTA